MTAVRTKANRFAKLPVQHGDDSDSGAEDAPARTPTHEGLAGKVHVADARGPWLTTLVDKPHESAGGDAYEPTTDLAAENAGGDKDSRRDYSPTDTGAVYIAEATHGSDMDIEDDHDAALSIVAIAKDKKGKGRAGTARTADEAGLTPPPKRKFKNARHDINYEEGPTPSWYEPYSPLPLPGEDEGHGEDEDVTMDDNDETAGGGFMADARKSARGGGTRADVSRDEAYAQQLHEQLNGPEPATYSDAAAAPAGPPVPALAPTTFPIRATSANLVRRATSVGVGTKAGPSNFGSLGAFTFTGPSKVQAGTAQTAGAAAQPHSAPQAHTHTPAATAPTNAPSQAGISIPADLNFTMRLWKGPVPVGPTFKSLTIHMDPEQRDDWLNYPGEATTAYPCQPGSANGDVFAQKVQMICDGIFRGQPLVEVSAAYEHNGLRGPLALIIGTKAQIDFLNGQRVINNSLQPFFCVPRDQQPSSMTHTVTGFRLPDSPAGEKRLLDALRPAVAKNQDLADWLAENGDAVPAKVTDAARWIADGLRVWPVCLNLPGTNVPGVWWNVFSRNRPARDEEDLEVFREIMEKIEFKDTIAGKYQKIGRRFHCSICLGCTHSYGLCDIASHPDWLGERPRTKNEQKTENKGIVFSEMRYVQTDSAAQRPRNGAQADKNKGRKK
ncbi:hypothetical protein AURDEDRAFT_129138 [Auricularia subglabra TFB-10046 SS5]|uniref:Uncharacterized protein n=1 Tax=Auricularia subglabra (strain TFB-10046 / SS5) TaxID=717982 RepID=J0WWS7_AURST|nr:hypothetical protein AURDEDRAFT_129138 [Auricularia subglabra TFB-10046 SS5]